MADPMTTSSPTCLKFGLDGDPPVASLLDLESQDLTGLVGAASRRGRFHQR